MTMRKIVENMSPHPNVIDLPDVYEDKNGVHLVLELCSGGELFDRNRIVKQERYCEAGAAAVVRQTAQGLAALHSSNIVHRNLKTEKCLFLNNANDSPLKIMDFGLSSVEFTDPVVELFGSIDCHQRLFHRDWFTSKSDMWALDVIFYIPLSGYPPFISQSNQPKQHTIMPGAFSFHEKTWKVISLSAKQSISDLLKVDHDKRPSAQEVGL